MSEQVPPRRARLGAKLRELRARRFPSGLAFSKSVGWAQSRVSKLERGAQIPTDDDLDVWLAATDATDEDRDEVDGLRAHARMSYRTWSSRWSSPKAIAAVEDEIAALEQQATLIREYQPALIPGLVATRAYRRALLSTPAGPMLLGANTESVEAKVAAMMRRQEVLYEPGRHIQILLGEAALHTRFDDGDEVLRGQLARLVDLTQLDSVEVGILPFGSASPLLPLANFSLLDEAVAIVETATGEQPLHDPDEIAVYVRMFEVSWAAAVTGDEATAMLRG